MILCHLLKNWWISGYNSYFQAFICLTSLCNHVRCIDSDYTFLDSVDADAADSDVTYQDTTILTSLIKVTILMPLIQLLLIYMLLIQLLLVKMPLIQMSSNEMSITMITLSQDAADSAATHYDVAYKCAADQGLATFRCHSLRWNWFWYHWLICR